ncbi:MAG: hypothetical protein H0T46_22855 [Deltaproteobacteria bacterium]|nr:hypothetical protein [Deltaproteobacteria bacterium]
MTTKNTTQQLCRTAIEKQVTKAMYVSLTKRVMALIRYTERNKPWRDQRGPQDRINGAILKTIDGELTWDLHAAEPKSLEDHLFDAVSGDMSNELKRAQRFRHVSISRPDALELHEPKMHAFIEEASETPSEVPGLVLVDAIAKLREIAHRDRGVLMILDGYDRGAFTRREVMRVTGISRSAYDAAFKRLVRMAAPLAVEVLGALDEAI